MARKKYSDVDHNTMEVVSRNLKRIMFNKGLTQKDICDRSKLATSTISDYVNAKTLISMGNLNKIADALGVTKGEIYPIDDQNKNPDMREKGFDPFVIFELVKKYSDEELIEKYIHTDRGNVIDIEKIKSHLSHVRYLNSLK